MSIIGSNVLAGASGQAGGGYEIERSVRFNSSDSAYLGPVTRNGNKTTWTLSFWMKRCKTGRTDNIFGHISGGFGQTQHRLSIVDEKLYFVHRESASNTTELKTAAVFRDASAWYHIVVTWDTNNATSADRVRLYVNGTRVTAFDIATYPSSGKIGYINDSAYAIGIGAHPTNASDYLDGYLADIHFIDGQALTPSSFGEFDTNGVWQPIEFVASGPNNGTTWSSATLSNGGSLANLFDGSSSTSATQSTNGVAALVTGFGPVTVASKVSFYSPDGGAIYTLNGGSAQSFASAGWHEISFSGTLTSFTWEGQSNTRIFIYMMAVDGVTLIDGDTANIGTNGFHLPFSDNSTAAALGTDTSSNGNTWTVNNISVTAGAGNDSLVDSPTNGSQVDTGAGGEVVGNYCTWNPLQSSAATLANGNLDCTTAVVTGAQTRGTIAVSTGKWYWEVLVNTTVGANNIGIIKTSEALAADRPGYFAGGYAYVGFSGNKENNASASSYGATYGSGDVIGVALDLDAGTLVFYKNGASQGTAFSSLSGEFIPAIGDGTGGSGMDISANFGQRQWAYAAPAGFKALCTTNLPEPTIADGSTVMDVVLDTGANILAAAQGAISGSADLLWIKDRVNSNNHQLIDTVRGGTATLQSNTTAAETTYVAPSGSSVAWTWDAGGTTDPSNEAGSITSQVRANASAGFSVVSWSSPSNPNTGWTVGHGLGVAPSLIINKQRGVASGWYVYHSTLGGTQVLQFHNTNAAASNSSIWNNTSPTSTVINFGGSGGGGYYDASTTQISYCFAPVAGYSSFGSYTGNGSSTDGPFVYTGFRSRWIMIKASSFAGEDWVLLDTEREPYNPSDALLKANTSEQEFINSVYNTDITSSGFKVRNNNPRWNQSSATYIYYAVAENPFQYARAR
jgi:hypothetical protein